MDLAKKFLAENLPDKALERLKKILPTVNPSDEWKVHELIGAAFHDLCDAEGAVQASLNAAKTDVILRTQRRHFSNYIFALHYLNVDAEILFDAAKIYNSLYRDAEQNYSLLTTDYSLKTINVAFVAPHFLDSSSARFYEPLLTLYDREKFFVTAWSLSNDEDDFTKKIRRSVDGYFDVSEISFEETAQKIHDIGADILFDLGGHTEGGATLQIAAYKPARVQISGIGYFDTTGLDAIDFYLTDKFLIDGSENFFTENILTLDEAGDYETLLDENIRIIGTKVFTKSGVIQGKVTEISVAEDGKIEMCEITDNTGAVGEIPSDKISIFGKLVTVIETEAEKKNLAQ